MKQQINDNTYFSIQAWMVTKLNLKGAERDVYAIIYGYSQDNDSDFHGSLDYISQLTGYSRNAICTALKSLTDSGLITKTEKIVNNIKYCRYRTSSLYTVQVACTENEKSVQVTCINNNKLNNKLNNNTISKDIVEKSKSKKLSLYDKCMNCITDFTDDAILQSMLEECLKMFLTNSRESGIPFYTNNFKGKLNKLKLLSIDNYIQRDIVKQTIDNGWNGFYELKKNKKNTGDARTNIERLSTKPVPRMTDEQIKERNRRIENGELEQF